MADEVVIPFTKEQFVNTSEPFDYLVRIENAVERDIEINTFKKFVAKNYSISAAMFKEKLKEAEARLQKVAATNDSDALTAFTGQPCVLRCAGYYCNDSGVWKDSAYGPVRVLMHPIMPVARIMDYETQEHKTKVAFRIGNKWNAQIVSRDVLSSRAAFTKQMSLADAFVTSENCAGVITFLADIESQNIDLLPTTHSASKLGWHEKRFLPFEEELLFDGDIKYRAAFDSIKQHGNEATWYKLVKSIREHKDWIIERCALAASFASVLLDPLKGTSFFVHIWSDLSSTGKTVALLLAGSVWGNPRLGKYCQSMNSTNVGMEMMAGFLGNLPLCMDELCTKDRHDGIEDMVYNYCLNSGRIRGSRNGGIQRLQTWCNCAITTGETPIITERSRAGEANRVLELEANGKLFGGKAKQTAAILNENYGFAGKVFISALQQDGAWDEVGTYIREYESELAKFDATEKQFISMATLLAADKFAARHVFNDDNYLTADDVKHLVKTEDDVDTNRRMYENLMGMIAENNMRFEPTPEHYNGPIWGKLDETAGQSTVACIISSRFNSLISDIGGNSRSFMKWARRMNVILPDSQGKSTRPVRLDSMQSGLTRCVCIRMNAFEESRTQSENSAPDGYSQVDMSEEDIPW